MFLLNDAVEKTEVSVVGTLSLTRRIVWNGTVVIAAVLWLLGTILWVTVQDGLPILSGLYYALPMPLLIIAGVLVTREMWRRQWDRRLLTMCLGIVVGQLVFWGMQTFRSAVEKPSTDAYRFVFWNVCRGYLGYDGIARALQSSDADIIALVESVEEAQAAEFWTTRLEGYVGMRLGSGMMILCRGKILEMQPGNVTVDEYPEAICRYRIVSMDVDGHPLRVLLMDVKSNPLMVREPAFKRLDELAGELADQPLIVAADFNTPIDSIWVDYLRSRLTNSFEAAGQGYRETWPTFLPVLCLDQVWANDRVTFHRSRNGWSFRSDHRSVTTEFSLKP